MPLGSKHQISKCLKCENITNCPTQYQRGHSQEVREWKQQQEEAERKKKESAKKEFDEKKKAILRLVPLHNIKSFFAVKEVDLVARDPVRYGTTTASRTTKQSLDLYQDLHKEYTLYKSTVKPVNEKLTKELENLIEP